MSAMVSSEGGRLLAPVFDWLIIIGMAFVITLGQLLVMFVLSLIDPEVETSSTPKDIGFVFLCLILWIEYCRAVLEANIKEDRFTRSHAFAISITSMSTFIAIGLLYYMLTFAITTKEMEEYMAKTGYTPSMTEICIFFGFALIWTANGVFAFYHTLSLKYSSNYSFPVVSNSALLLIGVLNLILIRFVRKDLCFVKSVLNYSIVITIVTICLWGDLISDVKAVIRCFRCDPKQVKDFTSDQTNV